MPLTKIPKKREPLWKEWNHLADKKGVRSTVYSVNGDQYTGARDKDKKNGRFKSKHSILLNTNLLRFCKLIIPIAVLI